MIDENLEEDRILGMYHGGVIKALHDLFQDKYQIMPNSKVWYYIKEKAL